MTKPKKHHYVPRFLLRNFTEDGDKLATVIIESGQFVSMMSTRVAAQRYRLYLDSVETGLSPLEGEASSLIKKIIQDNDLPDRNGIHKIPLDYEYTHLLQFLLVPRSRSYKTKLKQEELVDQLAKIFLKEKAEREGISLDDYKIKLDDMQFNETILDSVISRFLLISDLRLVLLHNKTTTRFAISDDPLVMYNLAYIDGRGI